MAKKKKKTKTKTKAQPRTQSKAGARRKKTSAPTGGRKAKTKSAGSEVEQRWQEYWRCRKQLEDACDTVRAAQHRLGEAVEVERERRGVFEQTKKALEQLLEVAPPSAAGAPAPQLDLVSDEPRS